MFNEAMRKRILLAVILCAAGVLPSHAAGKETPPAERPAAWAQKLERKGVRNLHRVSDTLYRGAQPTRGGVAELAALGVKTIVNLRSTKSDKLLVQGSSVSLVELDFSPWKNPKDKVILEFLRVVTDPARGPCYVHCKVGADRTGVAVAAYRVVAQGWSKDEALRELRGGGFGFHANIYDGVFDYPKYIQDLDVPRLRSSLGLKP